MLADLEGRIDAILDAGPCDGRSRIHGRSIPRTDPAIIYRPGGVTAEQIRRVLGDVVVAERESPDEVPPEALESPGLGIRHYAPRARLVLVESEAELSRVLERRPGTIGWECCCQADGARRARG